ncbi:MAG: tetratricopeptide repeat protein [Acidobacteria bacterium]|nr:tetratricopeptide repeat protein [Acidobacteriota bacterium]
MKPKSPENRASFRAFRVLFRLLLPVLAVSCGGESAIRTTDGEIPAATRIESEADASEATIRFLEDRIRRDPDDFISANKLGGYYLLRLRETGNTDYLRLARRTADISLRAIAAQQNPGGLALLAQAAFAEHDFESARRCAEQLVKIDPRKSYPYQLLADALLELGDYDAAAKIIAEIERSPSIDDGGALRIARMAALHGQTARAREFYGAALALSLEVVPPSREGVAWRRWQIGELEFNAGRYDAAERHYRDSLETFPNYYRALSGLGRARAAQGDVPNAIEFYERAARLAPEPATLAALGDLYELTGRSREAQAQFDLVKKLGRIGEAAGSVYNRQLAIFFADHDINAEEAYELARREYEVRRDIYGADALAWTAHKAGRADKAGEAILDALKLGTKDSRIFYHAGMIARAAGNPVEAKKYLERALALSPQFDPRHAPVARQALEALKADNGM